MSNRSDNQKNELLSGIVQINQTDTISQFMEKCNNNFSKISEIGGGPAGVEGEKGSQGVPTKPKVPIHVWKKDSEYFRENLISETEKELVYELVCNPYELYKSKYQEGHLILLENAHVYILEVDKENNVLTPKFFVQMNSYNPDSVIDGKSAYVHIAFANSSDGTIGFTLSEDLKEDDNKQYMGIYSDNLEASSNNPKSYTWVKTIGVKGDKGDTPTSTSVEAIGYSLSDLELKSEEWKPSISDLGTLKPGSFIYIKNKYTWGDDSTSYGKTVTMTGTQGVKGDKGDKGDKGNTGDTGRVLLYLGSFKDGTLTGDSVTGYLNEYRCDYYIDTNDVAWMRTGTSESAMGLKDGKSNSSSEWIQSEKIGFLKAGSITVDMINKEDLETLLYNQINEQIGEKSIGGENIIPNSQEIVIPISMTYPMSESILNPFTDIGGNHIPIKAGTYVFSAENAKCLWYHFKYGTDYSESIPFTYCLRSTFTDGTYSNITPNFTKQNSAIKDIVFSLEREAIISLIVSYNQSSIPESDMSSDERVAVTLTNVMLQRGNKSTSYQPYVGDLIKGKIGILEISDTQAIIKTKQGEILIDATDGNEGIYVKDKSKRIKTAIVGGKIEDYVPLDDEVIISKNVTIKSDEYENKVFTQGVSGGTCTTARDVTFNLKQHISVSEPCYCKVSVKVYGRLTQTFNNTEYESSNATIQFTINSSKNSPLSNSITQNNLGYEQNGVSPGQYFMEITRLIQTNDPMATYNNNLMYLTPNLDFNVRVDVNTQSGGYGWCLAKLTGELTFVIEVTRLWSYGYEPKIVIATDGIITAYDKNNYFMIKTTTSGQKISVKGLPDKSTGLEEGMLYNDKGTLKIKMA